MIKLFVDDVRDAPNKDWIIVRSVGAAQKYLSTMKIDEISLDHDLGENQPTGYDLAKWMSQHHLWPEIVRVHSANPVGANNIVKEYEFYLRRMT